MAIKLIANYAKRLGLPGYSSHNFSVTVETELVDLGAVQGEATRLYSLLQDAVDREIQTIGFIPPADYGMEDSPTTNVIHGLNGHNGANGASANGHAPEHWRCSDKQKDLILKLVDEHHLDKNEVDHLARQRFGKGVRQLGKLEASGLIDELLETHSGNQAKSGRPNGRRSAYASAKRNGGGR